ncbi:hypothetical protein NG895_28795 [Aeoliella sp. ICT_H6.2]|uniref:Tetratricopeptide repeat protein n=1 Tax=Aeoliella straminimaris TaxID=2954799 RepID=A0A9X2JJR3_9BACT|nr:hypothetical protein [Aeoliella straminimaris]MCO6047922.1 hypothetical protein [Aeoliella straminimaris]
MQKYSFVPFLLGAIFACAALATFAPGAFATSDEPVEQSITPWSTPSPESVEASIVEWMVDSSATSQEATEREAGARAELDRLFTSGDRLDAVMHAVAMSLPEVAETIEACRTTPLEAMQLDWLDSAEVPYWIRSNVRLYVGRALVQQYYYGQALEVLEGLKPSDVFDPASLLFYRSIAEHQLVQIDEAKGTLATLLDAEQEMPERFAQIARLMQADIAKVKEDSLDHIARRMSDVERRLSLSDAGDQTQGVELGILASLDKTIEKLEEQARQRQQQQQQAGSQQSGTPMEDSQPVEQKGEGKVDIKDIGDASGWGNLPPRERERVMQQIGRDFPGHYRDLMEEYLKRLATDEREESQP